jgi:hypothetical protein
MKKLAWIAVIGIATWIGAAQPAPADPPPENVCLICGTEQAPCYFEWDDCTGPEGIPACATLQQCFGG